VVVPIPEVVTVDLSTIKDFILTLFLILDLIFIFLNVAIKFEPVLLEVLRPFI